MDPSDRSFPSYEKIAERPADWGLDEKGWRALARVPWVVTEKIHGANFVILTDGSEAAFAKRKAILGPDEEFFVYQILASRLTRSAATLSAALREEDARLKILTVYGELFGGAYPHPSVLSLGDYASGLFNHMPICHYLAIGRDKKTSARPYLLARGVTDNQQQNCRLHFLGQGGQIQGLQIRQGTSGAHEHQQDNCYHPGSKTGLHWPSLGQNSVWSNINQIM